MRRVLALAFLLFASPAWSAIVSIGDLTNATCAMTTPSSTLICSVDATLEVDNVSIVFIATDNTGTTDADHGEVSSVVDSASNVYSKLCEFTNGNGAAAAGATVSLWMTRATNELTSGGTFTVTFANLVTTKAANAREFTVAAALELVGSCQTEVRDATDAGSMTISGLSSAETLFFRAIAVETSSGTSMTPSTNYSLASIRVEADSGGESTGMAIDAEFRITTATGDSSDPTQPHARDNASVYVALREQVAGPARRPVSPIMF